MLKRLLGLMIVESEVRIHLDRKWTGKTFLRRSDKLRQGKEIFPQDTLAVAYTFFINV